MDSSDAMAHATFMDAKEFSSAGYLQEVNRRVLHPLGLYLVLQVSDEGVALRVLDAREDPGGIVFDEDPRASASRQDRAEAISEAWVRRGRDRLARYRLVDYQPISSAVGSYDSPDIFTAPEGVAISNAAPTP